MEDFLGGLSFISHHPFLSSSPPRFKVRSDFSLPIDLFMSVTLFLNSVFQSSTLNVLGNGGSMTPSMYLGRLPSIRLKGAFFASISAEETLA